MKIICIGTDHPQALRDLVAAQSGTCPSDCSTFYDGVGYAANLQRAIEFHCRGRAVPDALAKHCPYHAKMLNDHLSNAGGQHER